MASVVSKDDFSITSFSSFLEGLRVGHTQFVSCDLKPLRCFDEENVCCGLPKFVVLPIAKVLSLVGLRSKRIRLCAAIVRLGMELPFPVSISAVPLGSFRRLPGKLYDESFVPYVIRGNRTRSKRPSIEYSLCGSSLRDKYSLEVSGFFSTFPTGVCRIDGSSSLDSKLNSSLFGRVAEICFKFDDEVDLSDDLSFDPHLVIILSCAHEGAGVESHSSLLSDDFPSGEVVVYFEEV